MKVLPVLLVALLPVAALAQSAPVPEKKSAAEPPRSAQPAPSLKLRLDPRDLRSTLQPSSEETYKKQDADGGLPGLGGGSDAASKILEQQPSPEKIVPPSNDKL